MLVEDEPAHAEAIRRALQSADLEMTVQVAESLQEYRHQIAESPPQMAVVDLNLPDGRALDILTAPPEAGPFPVLIMTSYGSQQMAVEALKSGALDYIVKSPETFAEMPRIVERVMREWRLLRERNLAHARIQHLNSVLRAVRNVSQLILTETSAEQMIRAACDLMVSHRSYDSALIVLTDDNGRPDRITRAGPEGAFQNVAAELTQGRLPACCKSAVDTQIVHVAANTDADCTACPRIETCAPLDMLCIALRHDETTYGCLAVAVEHTVAVDPEEQALFAEMAGDLAYGLHNIAAQQTIREADEARARLEAQLIHAQRMESVGRLAGGVAHDYNNMLSAIIGYTELVIEKVAPDDPLQGDLQEILAASLRSAEITRQLLAFARQQAIAPKVLDLNASVEGTLRMLRRLIGEDIDLAWVPEAGLWPVMMDPVQVDQLLANLCVNARDAIAGVGKVTIETGKASLDEAHRTDHAGIAPGEFVLLTVSDDGCGMDQETLGKIFEPFFTTKEIGQGTGLGMATVYGIVKQNKGFIRAFSEPGKGTTIKIFLPRHTGHVEPLEADKPDQIPHGRGELLMIVEDEPAILKMSRKMMEKLDYRVLTAGTPDEALRLARQHSGAIDLLITDVIMPEMNGRELARQLHGLCPQIKILYMSGYTASVIAHQGVLDEGVNFIQKPLSMKRMALKVRAVLDRV